MHVTQLQQPTPTPISTSTAKTTTATVRISARIPLRKSSRSGKSHFGGMLDNSNLKAAAAIAATPPIILSTSSSSSNNTAKSSPTVPPTAQFRAHHPHRVAKPSSNNNRKAFAKVGSMEPPVQSFYGANPIPLPNRFANIKRRLIQGREAAIEASWRRLLVALKNEIEHIDARRKDLIPTIDFASVHDPTKVEPFERDLKRYGVAVIRGVVSQTQTEEWIRQTRDYITRNRDQIKPPPAQDPTCFDLFWTPAQVSIRAHPSVLKVQKWAMSFWESKSQDADISRVATRFPISYADRLRIHDGTILGSNAPPMNSAANSAFSSAGTLIAQVDNGSLERWEPDGYGRGGAYDAVFRGEWEDLDPWDPSGRVGSAPDLYNGAGCCSIFRMFQGVLALTSGEPASIRVMPSPKLVVAYLLLRPFFSSKTPPPPADQPDDESSTPENQAAWAAFLDADNWVFDKEQTTVIHGAVPGHAQRITELWHPHLRLRRSLVEIPTLQAGDYVIWHCDEAYSIMTTSGSKNGTPSPDESAPSMLMYTPACPLTQTNALFLARQRKAFEQGQPGPDFDSAGSAIGSEAPHEGRPGKDEIAQVGGEWGLRAMGLAPWELDGDQVVNSTPAGGSSPREVFKSVPSGSAGGERMDIDGASTPASAPELSRQLKAMQTTAKARAGEAEVVRLANIILFPDRYDFYFPTEPKKPAEPRMSGKAQAEQMAATRLLISRVLS